MAIPNRRQKEGFGDKVLKDRAVLLHPLLTNHPGLLCTFKKLTAIGYSFVLKEGTRS
jgi:hypothetical protein